MLNLNFSEMRNLFSRKKIIIIQAFALLFTLSAMAQEKKVAVFDPVGEVENPIKEMLREEISAIIVNTNGFTVLERHQINKVLEENKFQMSGLVDDSQISEIGRLMGANFVIVTHLTFLENRNYHISCKLIDMQSARIEKQRTAQTARGASDLISITQKIVGEMLSQTAKGTENTKQGHTNVTLADVLIADGGKVSMNGRKLSKGEVRSLMVNVNAMSVYNRGISYTTTGIALISSGSCFVVAGAGLLVLGNRKQTQTKGMEGLVAFDAGISLVVIGSVALIPGITLKVIGNKRIQEAVDLYNRGGKFSSYEIKFGFTGNGVGMSVNF